MITIVDGLFMGHQIKSGFSKGARSVAGIRRIESSRRCADMSNIPPHHMISDRRDHKGNISRIASRWQNMAPIDKWAFWFGIKAFIPFAILCGVCILIGRVDLAFVPGIISAFLIGMPAISYFGEQKTSIHDGHVVELPNKASIEMWKGMSDKGKSALVKIALGYYDDDAAVAHDKVRVAADITSDEFMREAEQEVNDILAGRA